MEEKEKPKPKEVSKNEMKNIFMTNPLDRIINPRMIVQAMIDKKRADSLMKRLEKHYASETNEIQNKTSIDLPKSIELVNELCEI